MVHCYKIDEIYEIRKKLLSHGKKMKLIMIGDPFQLPPVTTRDLIKSWSKKLNKSLMFEDFYFFQSKIFQEDLITNMKCFLLTEYYRQKSIYFQKVLNRIAIGEINKEEIDFINQRVIKLNIDTIFDYTPIIVPTRMGAKLFNKHRLCRFDFCYFNNPVIEWKTKKYEEIKNDYGDIIEPVFYAIGSNIVFTQNDYNGHWVNGTRGIVTNITWGNNSETILDININDNKIVKCSPTRHFLKLFIYNQDKDTVENQCVAIVWQFPFISGYALTVHRSQGMTLDVMSFNIGSGIFSPGQLYVALSRVRDIGALNLHVPIGLEDVKTSRVTNKYFDIFIKKCKQVVDNY
jgi:ATP-dependent exoDNAse (exonuclease V) alpha subunit